MRRFMNEHMDFTRLQSNVIKHVNLMSELSETVTRRNLMEVSEVCACQG
jgi:vacuolar protein sorting-associated protein 45